MQASVTAVGIDSPPPTPALGAAWIVGTSPDGAWVGHAGALAGWTAGGWRYIAASEGMAVWDQTSGEVARVVGGVWTIGTVAASRITIGGIQVVGAQAGAIGDPAGGAVIDGEARTAIGSILAALRGHGLVAG